MSQPFHPNTNPNFQYDNTGSKMIISGVITIDNQLYDAQQVIQSIILQGFFIKRFGSTLKVGNQLITPIPPSQYPTGPVAQNIIDSQFQQLFEEINKLKEKIEQQPSAFTAKQGQTVDNEPRKSQFLQENSLEETTQGQETWEQLINQKEEPSESPSAVEPEQDLGEANLQRKWASTQYDQSPLNKDLPPDLKFKTEYYTLGLKKRKSFDFTKHLNKQSVATFKAIHGIHDEKASEQDQYADSSLDQLAEELINKIEDQSICPKCLSNIPANAYFCSKCGLKVKKKELKIPETFETPEAESYE